MFSISIIVAAGLVILVIYLLLNKKTVEQEREGVVTDVLKKDAFVVEFEDGKPTVVKPFGVVPASENEMLDDKIFAFYDEFLRGRRVLVKPRSIGTGDVLVAEIHTLGGEYVNGALVRRGFARWSPTEAANDLEIAEAQVQAKRERLGVWNPAIQQLVEEKRRKLASDDLSDEDIANMSVDPEDPTTREGN